jgi:tape measure domain-containing protein
VTDQSRNVELVIRAKNLTKKTISDVSKDIGNVTDALDEQIAASKRGEGSLKDLEKSYGKLEDAMKSLLQQQAAIKTFEAQRARLEDLEKAQAAATTRLEQHRAAMEAAEKVTKRQETQLASYERAVVKADTAITQQTERLAKAGKAAEELGVDLNDLVGSQDRILAAGRQLSTQYDRQAQAVENFAYEAQRAAKAQQELAAATAFDKAAQKAGELNKAGEYVRFWTTELDKMDAAQREAAASADFTKAAQKAAELNRASEYVRFWTEQLDKMDAAQRRADNSQALNTMADRALAAARGYRTLGDASQRLVQNNNAVGKSLREILDPAGAARTTLAGVEEELRSIDAAAKAATGPITNYREQVQALAAANKALAGQASLIDTFQRQSQAVREARAQFVQNRTALQQYAASVRSAEAPTAEMAAELKRLESALAASAQAYRSSATAARTTQTALREAGVATNDLVASQQRLTNAAKNSVGAMTNLNAAMNTYGTEAREAAASTNLFESNGRTALSFMQRIRGEVLALAAAYVGLQGAIGLANNSLNASNSKIAIQNQLALMVGDDPQKIAEEYAYIRGQADRIGVSFEAAAKGYAKFAAAASLAGRSAQEIRYVSEAFQEVGVVAGLTADDMGGVFKALEQIYSKGKIQAEELRGQLGDRLFGAFEIAAKALKDQFPSLDKAMKDGLVTSEQLLAIAEQYRKTVANRLPTAMESLRANQERLNNAFFDFKVLIADSGFATEYEKLVIKVSEFLRSDDGTKLAQNLSAAFAEISKWLGIMLDHYDEIALAVELAFGVKVLSLVAGLATAITTKLVPALLVAQAELTATGIAGASAATLITTAFAAVVALFAGFKIGEYMYEQFEWAQRAGIAMAEKLTELVTALKFAYNAFSLTISTSLKNAFNEVLNTVKDLYDDTLRYIAKGADSLGRADLAAAIRDGMTDGSREGRINAEAELAKLKKSFNDDMELTKNMFELQRRQVGKEAGPTGRAAPTSPPTDLPPKGKPKGDPDADAAEQAKLVKKRIALGEQLVTALEQAEAKIQRNEKLSLEQRLAAIDTGYEKTFRKIDALAKLPGGQKQAAQLRDQLNLYVSLQKEQERLKFAEEERKRNLEEVKEAEKRINELIALRTQLLQNVEIQRKTGGITDNEAKEQVAGIDASYVPQIQAATEATMQLAAANQAAFGNDLAFQNYMAKLQAIPGSLKVVQNELITTRQVNEKLASGITQSFVDMGAAMKQGEGAIRSFGDSFLNMALRFLQQIAQMIMQQIILNALMNSSIGGAIAGTANRIVAPAVQGAAGAGISSVQASQRHSGGMAGMTGVTRAANASWFNNAPSYGGQGVIGLKSNEYPTILKRNEEVLTENDPRNAMNGGEGGGQPAPNTTVINVFNEQDLVEAALSSPAGDKLLINRIKNNSSSIKQVLK